MQKDCNIPEGKRKAVGDFHLQWWRWVSMLSVHQFQTEAEIHENLLFTKMFTVTLLIPTKTGNFKYLVLATE